MTAEKPRIWVLLGGRRGDNNQLLALAEALGLPFETRTLRYNLLRGLGNRLLGASLASLDKASRRSIAPPWPDLVLGIGWRSVPVGRWIKRRSGAKLVRVGGPRADPALFDLVVTTRQYPVAQAENVLVLPLAMSRFRRPPKPTRKEGEALAALPRPHLLMAIGGATKYWQLRPDALADAARKLAGRAEAAGGALIVVGSPRTEEALMRAVGNAVAGSPHCRFMDTDRLRIPVLLDDADGIFVTGDSVAMLSEAVVAGKAVGLIPIELSESGKRVLDGPGTGERRDLRRFWDHLQSTGLVGTLDAPARGTVEDPAQTAAAAVRRLLGDVA